MLRLPGLCNVFLPTLLSHLCVGEENAHSFFLQQLKLKLRVEEFAMTSYTGKGLSQKGHFSDVQFRGPSVWLDITNIW